jgi:hypothetical protein
MKHSTLLLVFGATVFMVQNAYANGQADPVISQQKEVVRDDAWAHHYSYMSAQELCQSGIWDAITGHGPDETIKQGEFVDLLLKVTGQEPPEALFNKEEELTRAEAAKWVAELTQLNTGIAGQLKPPFQDLENGNAYNDAIAYVYHTGIMGGDGTRFYPNNRLTRGQAAVILDHVLMRMPQMAREISFEKVEQDLPASVQSLIEAHKKEAGIYSVSEGGFRYVTVTGGEKPTGGYSVSIDHIYETKHAIYVEASTKSPEPGTFVPMIVTYPFAVAKIKETNKPVYLLRNHMMHLDE